MTNQRTFDSIVIGGGIVGAACASALARDGRRTIVIEARDVASGVTSAGMGHIVVMDDSDAQFALTDYSRRLWRELAPTLPPGCEYQNCGTLWVASDDEEMDEARRKRDFYAARGVESELVDAKGLRELEPELRDGLAGGLRVPGDSVVYQPRAAVEILDEAKRGGRVEVSIGAKVVEIAAGAVKLADGTTFSAETIVVANSLGANDFFPALGIVPKKGHLVITERYPGFVGHQTIELGYLKSAHSHDASSVAFNVQPRATGQILIGSSRQFGVGDTRVEPEMIARMTERAFRYMPRLRELAAVRAWTGLRPATTDNLPVIGRHPELAGVFIAAGHEGLGITTATGTAALIADMTAGRETAIDAAPYDPARFLSR